MTLNSGTHRRLGRERGVALIIALICLLILSTLAAAIMFTTQAEIYASSNYRVLAQARYTAEAGAQSAANWIIQNSPPIATNPTTLLPVTQSQLDLTQYPVALITTTTPVYLSGDFPGTTGNYPDSGGTTSQGDFVTAFDPNGNSTGVCISGPGCGASSGATLPVAASYIVKAQLMSVTPVTGLFNTVGYVQQWKITSQGSVAVSPSPAQVEVVEMIENWPYAVFENSIFAGSSSCPAITFQHSISIDSYSSSAGAYGAPVGSGTNSGGPNGVIRTNGTVTNAGNATRWLPPPPAGGSNITLPVAYSNQSGAPCAQSSTNMTPTQVPVLPTTASAPVPNPPPSPFPSSPPSGGACTTANGCASLSPNTKYSQVNLNSGTITLTSGIYYFDSLTLSGTAQLSIQAGASVQIFINSGTAQNPAVDMSGLTCTAPATCGINNPGPPGNAQLYYGGSNAVKVGSAGANGAAMTVYAPNADVTESGAGAFYGSLFGSVVNYNGSGNLHYDSDLQKTFFIPGNIMASGFSWSKY